MHASLSLVLCVLLQMTAARLWGSLTNSRTFHLVLHQKGLQRHHQLLLKSFRMLRLRGSPVRGFSLLGLALLAACVLMGAPAVSARRTLQQNAQTFPPYACNRSQVSSSLA